MATAARGIGCMLAGTLIFCVVACESGPNQSVISTPSESSLGRDAIVYVKDSGSTNTNGPRGGVAFILRRDGSFFIAERFPLAEGAFDAGALSEERTRELVRAVRQATHDCHNALIGAPDERFLVLGCNSDGTKGEVAIAAWRLAFQQNSQQHDGRCVTEIRRLVDPLRDQLRPFFNSPAPR